MRILPLTVLLIGSTTYYVQANESKTIPTPAITTSAQQTTSSSQNAHFQKIIDTKCKTDKNGYVVDAKSCVEAKSKLYVSRTRSMPTFRGFIADGIAEINVDTHNLQWGQRRNIAFKQAIQHAQVNYITNLNIDHFKTTQVTHASSGEAPNFSQKEKDNYHQQQSSNNIKNKLFNAITKKLDPDSNTNDEEKINNLTKSAYTDVEVTGESTELNVAAELSGVYVVKTYEAITAQGVTWVAAVVRGSINTKRQVAALYEGGSAYQPVKEKQAQGINPHQWFSNHYENLYKEFGSRLIWDEEGYPVMLSFGQASNWLAKGTEKYDRYDQHFVPSMARNDAIAAMSRVFNLQGSLNSKNFTGTKTGEKMTITYDGKTQSQMKDQVNNMITNMDELAKMSSKISGMQGVTILGQYENYHPITGQKIIGYVLAWSPKYAAKAQAYNAEKGADTTTGIGQNNAISTSTSDLDDKHTPEQVDSSISESSDLMDNTDF